MLNSFITVSQTSSPYSDKFHSLEIEPVILAVVEEMAETVIT